jgi:beta-lactamase regulating signal transducer with metallopeptidase domain
MDASELALQGLAFVLTYAIHSTLLLGLACVIAPRLARSLASRERVWKTAMFGGIVTALVQVGASMETPLFHWTLRAQEGERESLAAAAGPRDAARLAGDATPVDSERASSPTRGSSAEESAPRTARAPRRDPSRLGLTETAAPSGPQLSEEFAPAPELESAPESARDGEFDSAAPHAAEAAFLAAEPESAPSDRAVEGAPEPALAAVAPKSSFATRWREWTAHGLLAWAAFGAGVLALFGAMCVRLSRRMRGRQELEAGPLREALDRLLPRAFPAGRRVRLYVAPELRAPVSFGFVRFSICVPPRALVELSEDEQESMLAHELAHLMRRDPLWLSMAWLVERLFFFQPLHRVARAELHDLAELACDDWAARRTGNRLALASCLARIAEWIVGAPRALPATSMAELHGRCRLAQRIERLLDDENSREEHTRRWIAPVAAVGLAALVLVVPGVSAPSVRRAQAPDEELGVELVEGLPDALSAALPGASDLACEPSSVSVLEIEAQPEPPQDAPPPPNAPPQDDAHARDPLRVARQPAAPTSIVSGGVRIAVPSAREREELATELASLSASLADLREELEPVRREADLFADDPQLARALDALAQRAGQLERRHRALENLIQVLETLESMPAHPSSTPSATRNSRSFPR